MFAGGGGRAHVSSINNLPRCGVVSSVLIICKSNKVSHKASLTSINSTRSTLCFDFSVLSS